MKDITKYQGVIPAFYACYDKDGEISVEGVKALSPPSDLQRRKGSLCRGILRRVYLPACGRA